MNSLTEIVVQRATLEWDAREYLRLVNRALRQDPPQWEVVRLYGRKLTDNASLITKLQTRERVLHAWEKNGIT